MGARFSTSFVLITLAATSAVAGDDSGLRATDAVVRSAEDRGLSEALDLAVRAGERAWLAYRVPTIEHNGFCCNSTSCCWHDEDDLEIGPSLRLGSRTMLVLLRANRGDIDRVRLADDGCEIDFAGQTVVWAGDAADDESLDLLERVLDTNREPLLDEVLLAIAYHEDGEAPLIERARNDPRSSVRREALFWLGQTREQTAELVFRTALSEDDPGVARHAVFVLSQYEEPVGLEYLARLLEQRERPELRKEALFWIGQSSAPDALEIVARILNG